MRWSVDGTVIILHCVADTAYNPYMIDDSKRYEKYQGRGAFVFRNIARIQFTYRAVILSRHRDTSDRLVYPPLIYSKDIDHDDLKTGQHTP